MSEHHLPALAESAKDRIQAKTPVPMQEINAAYIECKFGLFHIKLLCIAFVGVVASVLASATTSFLLPSAECSLNMSLRQKGILNAIPYLGMLLSTVVAGFLTDAFGRKFFVVGGFGGIFGFTLIAGTSQTYEVLITAKFFEGFFFGAAFSAMITLTSEFCHNGIRDRVMLCQSSFAAVSQIIVPAMAWGILPHDWRYSLFGGRIILNNWNFYLYAMSLWSFAAFILYFLFIPESPKFLITQNKFNEAREILIKIYKENTWKPAESFPYANIWKDKSKYALDEVPEQKIKTNMRHQLVVGLHNVKPIFQKPLVAYLFLVCFLNFLIMALYNISRLWFPQLSTIVEHYKLNGDQDLCVLLDTYTSELKIADIHSNASEICVPVKSGSETYINSIIVGMVCMVPYFVTGVLVNRVGKKPLYMLASVICVGTLLSLRWANTKTAVVALFSISVAISQVLMSLNQALIVQIFPTTTRTLAISMIMVFGRLGTLVGNITFPVLLDMGCVIPFYTMTGMMACVSLMSLFLPVKK